MRTLGALLCLALLTGACGDSSRERIVIAAGTTLVDSGLLEELAAAYESENPGVELSIVGEASAQVIELGRNGAADLLITHAPGAERAFIDGGGSVHDVVVFASTFVLLGPSDNVMELESLQVAEAFAAIAASGQKFASRADGSGTFERDARLSRPAGLMESASAAPLTVGTGH